MRVHITQPNLLKALAILSRVASTKTALPILANIKISAEKGQLSLSATNLEVAITHTTKGKIETEGSVTVPARLLYDFISQLPKSSVVDLNFTKTKLQLSAGSYSSHIQGASAEDFPALPTLTGTTTLTVPAGELKAALVRTLLVASHDETRPMLGGIYMHSVDGVVALAATDGYRLAEAVLPQEGVTQINGVVPSQTLQDVLRIIQDNDSDDVTLQFAEGQFGVMCGETTLVSRLIEGSYPQYRQLIPASSEVNVVVDRQELLTATKLAGLFARESGGSITFSASETDKTATVSSVASQVGDNTSTLSGKIKGSGEVVVNSRYLTDALGCFDTKEVSVRFSGTISPCVITAVNQPGYQHIVMPLKS